MSSNNQEKRRTLGGRLGSIFRRSSQPAVDTPPSSASKSATAAKKKAAHPSKPSKAPSKAKRQSKAKAGAKRKGGMAGKRQAAHKLTRGRVFVEITLADDQMIVSVEEAREIVAMNKDGETSNSYVLARIEPDVTTDGKAAQQTAVAKKTRKPKYGEKFFFALKGTGVNKDQTRLHLSLHNEGKSRRNTEFMGCMSFTLAEIEDPECPSSGWFRWLDEQRGKTQNQPFRVKRRAEMTEELMEIYHVGPKMSLEEVRRQDALDEANMAASAARAAKESSTSIADKVGLESFNYLKVLGRGAFGKVLLAEKKGTKDIFAVKVLNKQSVIEDDDVASTMIERRVLALGSQCPFLTRLHATFQTPDRMYFVMEFITGGDLLFHVQELEKFTEPQAQFMVGEVCLGLFYLHERGVIYRDLKLDNIMLTGDGHIKLADFGLAKENIWGKATTTTFCGTPGYLAPEIVQEQAYDCAVDWWALGVLTYELLVGDPPFDGDDEDELFQAIVRSPVQYPSHMSDTAQRFISDLLNRNPSTRLGKGETGRTAVRQHKFFDGLDWAKLEARQLEPRYVPPSKGGDPLANFDSEFTDMDVDHTPVDPYDIADIDQGLFANFTFVEGKTTPMDEEPSASPLKDFAWYSPDISREQAIQELQSAGTGRFLVRESQSQPGCYAISVCMSNKNVWHGLITPSTSLTGETQYKLYAREKFASIPELIEHYQHNAIAADSNGDAIVLVGEDDDDE